MPLFSSHPAAQPAVTHTIHHPFGELSGYREVQDHTGRLKVIGFPFALLADLVPTNEAVAACYILASRTLAYVGETAHVTRRLAQHRADASKAFAEFVYVVCGAEPRWIDKAAAIYLQERMTCRIEEAGLVEVQMGARPQCLDVQPHKHAWLERYARDAERLLQVAGCSALQPRDDSSNATRAVSRNDDFAAPAHDDGPMQIGAMGVAPAGLELELDYVGLWARGCHANDGFVVMAGSEVRLSVNPSASPIVHIRRAELTEEGVLASIPGVSDRMRLCVAIWFPSAAIAAKVVTGAHVASAAWVAPKIARPIHIAD